MLAPTLPSTFNINSPNYTPRSNSIYTPPDVQKYIFDPTPTATSTSPKEATAVDQQKILTSIIKNSNGRATLKSLLTSEYIIFKVSPSLSETRSVNYQDVQPLQAPGALQIFAGVTARTWSLDVKLVSRTQAEADESSKYIQLIKSWTMPHFGEPDKHSNDLGLPPDVLLFSAYQNPNNTNTSKDDLGKYLNINNIAVVITSYSLRYPDDVDWISNRDGTPVPLIWPITIALKETHSLSQFNTFDLSEYKQGNLPGF